jgi:Predicted small integral membrane protein
MTAPRREQKKISLTDRFTAFTRWAAETVGSVWASLAALLVIAIWAATGPLFGFSDTWQLVINTSTTIITFLMVFIIQHTQNHDSKALHLKLDEVIRAIRGARNDLVDLEDMSEAELKALAEEFAALHDRECAAFKKHGHDLTPNSSGAQTRAQKAKDK